MLGFSLLRQSLSPEWPSVHHIAEGDFEHLLILPLLSRVFRVKGVYHGSQLLCSAEGQTQGSDVLGEYSVV